MLTTNQILRLFPLLVMFLFALALALGLFNRDKYEARAGAMVGQTITPFQTALLGGGKSDTFDTVIWNRRVALLNVFASWCEPCKTEHPLLLELAKTGKVAIFGIAWKDKPADTLRWLQTRGNPYQAVGSDEYGQSTISLGLSGVPETLLISADGVVRYHLSGPLTEDRIKNEIIPLIDQWQAVAHEAAQPSLPAPVEPPTNALAP